MIGGKTIIGTEHDEVELHGLYIAEQSCSEENTFPALQSLKDKRTSFWLVLVRITVIITRRNRNEIAEICSSGEEEPTMRSAL